MLNNRHSRMLNDAFMNWLLVENATYEADSRTWLEIIDAYKDLLEMDHPATRRQFEKHKEAYQKRNFIDGIFDPRGLLTAPSAPVPPTLFQLRLLQLLSRQRSTPRRLGSWRRTSDAKGFAELGRKLVSDDNMPEAGLVALDRAMRTGVVGKWVYFNQCAEAYSRLGDYRHRHTKTGHSCYCARSQRSHWLLQSWA
jgi:hypothetical protein